jgi:DNA-binding transcriptional regulator YdaS (Cro superfamily)
MDTKPKNLDRGIWLAIRAMGGHRKLGRLLGISHQAIGQWDRIPGERLIEIEILTGVPREELRPDLYRGFRRIADSHASHRAAVEMVLKEMRGKKERLRA